MAREESLEFDAERAAAYDDMFAAVAPIKGALHLLTRLALDPLPADARVLIVGAGTGDDLLYLAGQFPGWRFTVVDPSAPMLAICEKRIAQAGIGERCAVHAGFVHDLPDLPPHDAAVAHFVSHFLVEADDRRAFFRSIAVRLTLGGHLVSADIAGDRADPDWPGLQAVWEPGLRLCGMDDEARAGYWTSLGRKVALHRPEAVADIIAAGGFHRPLHICRMLHMHAWHARRA